MGRIESLAAAYASLQKLLEEALTRPVEEERFQAWFETHPLVFEVLGFRRWIAKPALRLGDGERMEPDFLALDYAGAWTVLEIKRADTIVLKNPHRRTDLRAEYSTYVEQCREYSDFFLDSAHRDQVKADYSIDVQRLVPALLIAAVDESTDGTVLREKLVDRGGKVAAQTYTAVLEAIGREMDRIGEMSMPGKSFLLLMILPSDHKRQVLLDFGKDVRRNRLRVAFDDPHFVFTVFDSEGHTHETKARRPIVVDFANANLLTMLEVELGVDREGLLLRAFVNQRLVVAQRISGVTIDRLPLQHSKLGTDLEETTPANFSLLELIFYERTLTHRERMQLREYVEDVYAYYLSPLAIRTPNRATFKGLKVYRGPDTHSLLDERGVSAHFAASQGVSGIGLTAENTKDDNLRPRTKPLPGAPDDK